MRRVGRGHQIDLGKILLKVGLHQAIGHQRHAFALQLIEGGRASGFQWRDQYKRRGEIGFGKAQHILPVAAGGKCRCQIGFTPADQFGQLADGRAAHQIKLEPGARTDFGQQVRRQAAEHAMFVIKIKRQKIFCNGDFQARVLVNPALFGG